MGTKKRGYIHITSNIRTKMSARRVEWQIIINIKWMTSISYIIYNLLKDEFQVCFKKLCTPKAMGSLERTSIKKKHVTALSWNFLSAMSFSSVMTTDMGAGLVHLPMERQISIFLTWWNWGIPLSCRQDPLHTEGYKITMRTNGDLLFFYVTQTWRKLMVCIKISSQEVVKMIHKCHNLSLKSEAQNYYRTTWSSFTFKHTTHVTHFLQLTGQVICFKQMLLF